MSAQDDELIRRYQEASEQEDARPSAHVRGAVRAHAQMLAAAAKAAGATPPSPATSRAAANASHWKISALATVAVVGLTSLLMLQFERGTPEEKETAFGRPRAEAPAPARPPAAVAVPAPAPPMAANSEVPAASAVSPGSARDQASLSARSLAQKPAAAPEPGPAKPLAKTAPAPAVAETESAPAPGMGGAISGFPASPPLAADHSVVPQSAPPPAPSVPSAPPAEMRKRSALQDAPAAREAASPDAAAPAQALPHAPAAHSLQGNAARGSLAATAPRADLGRSSASLPDDLREAARAGHTLQVESLVHQGVPVDASDSAGKTALMLAALNGQAATVQKLLALGANPALADREGLNAAQHARRLGYQRIAELIDSAK